MDAGRSVPDEQVIFSDVLAAGGEERERRIDALVARMSLREKVNEMSGNSNMLKLLVMAVRYGIWTFDSGGCKRLGIPALRFTDGPRGVCLDHSTCFPVAMARGATWDPALQERVSSAIGVEARAQGATFYGGVCINLLRHPGWGRAQETFGEDPYHLGEMGVAAVRGAQKHLMACAKHYACNSIEESRFYVDVRVDERTLREVYLPHFRKCVDAGAASVMSAYNRVNGTYCGHHPHLLTEILKDEWGFKGIVMSDFVWGVRDGQEAANAGMDMEMPRRWRFGFGFKRKVARGLVDIEKVDDAARRIIRQKARFATVGDPAGYDGKQVASRRHTELALEVARKGTVLLKNESGALPLDRDAVRKVSVVGELAALPNIGDRGSSRVSPPYVVTPVQGIRDGAGKSVEVAYDNGHDLEFTRRKVAGSDAIVVVAGFTYKEEGEYISAMLRAGGDRMDLGLPEDQVELIRAMAAETDRCVVVLEGGSAVTTDPWDREVEAIVMAWYPGMEGGTALSEILFGDVNPGGRLPITFPESVSQLPFFDKRAKSIEYGYYHGYRHFDREGLEPSYAFGHGLSYTSFAYSDLVVRPAEIGAEGVLEVSATVTNSGSMSGDDVVQLYVSCPGSSVDRPVKELKGFERVTLGPGESTTVVMDVPASELAYYDVDRGSWVVEPAGYELLVGGSSRDSDLPLRASFRVK